MKFKEWCKQERIGRVEEGTSQDMCPTNGDALFHLFMCVLIWIILAIVLIFYSIGCSSSDLLFIRCGDGDYYKYGYSKYGCSGSDACNEITKQMEKTDD